MIRGSQSAFLGCSPGAHPRRAHGAPPPWLPALASLAPLFGGPLLLGSAFCGGFFGRTVNPSSLMLLNTGASEASAGSAWGWGPTRAGGGGAPPANQEMLIESSWPPH